MRIKSIVGTLAGVFWALALAAGCSVDPLKFAGRNACELLNCDVLFFVDDVLPLAGGPVAGGDAAPADEDSGGGGH